MKVSKKLLKGELEEFGFGVDGYPFWGTWSFLKEGGGSFQEFFHFHFVDRSKWSKFYTRMELGKLIYLLNGNITMLFIFTKWSGEKHKFH